MATVPKKAPQPKLWIAQPTVTFIVDREEIKQTFIVHKDFATANSDFFKAAFEGNFVEGQTQTMRLEDVEVHIFGLLVNWLYTRSTPYNYVIEGEFGEAGCLMIWAKLWTLAGRCLIPALQNSLLHRMIYYLEEISLTPAERKPFIDYAYATNDNSTPLKRLAVHTLAFLVDDNELKEFIEDAPQELMLDLTMALKKQSPEGIKLLPATRYYVKEGVEVRREVQDDLTVEEVPAPSAKKPIARKFVS